MRGMFASSQFNQEINGWDVSKVTIMAQMVRKLFLYLYLIPACNMVS